MPFPVQHEIHRRRFGRNLGVGILLAGFVALMFALSIVKVTQGDRMHANDQRQSGTVLPAAAQPEASQ